MQRPTDVVQQLGRVKTSEPGDGGFIVSFEGAFHGRTLGSLAVTHRKRARLGFPTFDWPHISFPIEEIRSPKETLRREERSLKQLWDLLVSGRLPRAEKSKDTFRREMDALDEFLARPPDDTATSDVVELRFQAEASAVEAVTIALGSAGIGIGALVPQSATLEELFLGMTEEEAA